MVTGKHNGGVTNFAKWILQIGDGSLGQANNGYGTIEIPKELFILNYTDPIDVIVKCKYPNRRQHYKDSEFLQSRAILASTNETVDHINDYVLSLISGIITYFLIVILSIAKTPI